MLHTQALSVRIASENTTLRSGLKILLASLIIGLCAQVRIPLFFTPICLSGQTFAVMFVGTVLGRRMGMLALLLYVAEGVLGLPVFAGGRFGAASLVGPSGGYIWGFFLQVYLAGWWADRKGVSSSNLLATLLLSCLLQLAVGALWLSTFIGFKQALIAGICPFVPGEIAKSFGVSALKRGHRNNLS